MAILQLESCERGPKGVAVDDGRSHQGFPPLQTSEPAGRQGRRLCEAPERAEEQALRDSDGGIATSNGTFKDDACWRQSSHCDLPHGSSERRECSQPRDAQSFVDLARCS